MAHLAPHPTDRQALRAQLMDTRTAFHDLLEGLTEADLQRPSGNPAWTVGAVLTHLVASLELLPREVASARRGTGMYNLPPALRDWLNKVLTRWAARGQTLRSLRHRYDRAFDAALATLDTLREEELTLGAPFWSEGFRDIAGLYAAQVDHLTEHGEDVRAALPRLAIRTHVQR